MSRELYCPRCGVVENIHSGVYCSRLSKSETLNATLRETIHTLRAELKKTRDVICNTAETGKAFCEQAEKARADWHAAENELWLGELREKIEKLREQRDRAMQIAYDLLDYTSISESDWSLYVDDLRNIIKNVNSLSDEISKEKWEE